MTDALIAAWQQVSWLEGVSVAFGLAYVILAARENIWCWPAAFISTGTAIFLFWGVSLPMESALNGFYLLMAIVGWRQWRHGGQGNTELTISRLRLNQHFMVVGAVGLLSFASGYWLSHNSSAALPYVDSFTTWAAVITTWMVTRKILENWLYWVVIDLVSMWLFVQRELYLYALLFALYTVIAIYGYRRWQRNYAAAD